MQGLYDEVSTISNEFYDLKSENYYLKDLNDSLRKELDDCYSIINKLYGTESMAVSIDSSFNYVTMFKVIVEDNLSMKETAYHESDNYFRHFFKEKFKTKNNFKITMFFKGEPSEVIVDSIRHGFINNANSNGFSWNYEISESKYETSQEKFYIQNKTTNEEFFIFQIKIKLNYDFEYDNHPIIHILVNE